MDKIEYKIRSEEIVKLIDKEQYAEAANVADTVDWRRVKSISMLLKIAALYSINRRNEDSRAILLLAYDKYPTNRSVVYSLCEISIELEDVVAAVEYYKQYAKIAPKDIGVIILHYRILEAQGASLEERIALLEELKKKDYQEEWALELADLYHRIGYATKCVEECDDIILWFGDGPNVMKAMELKQKHVPLTEVQQAKYENMLGNAQNNYSEQTYEENDNYTEDTYADSGYEENGEYVGEDTYAENGFVNDSYNEENYINDGYNEENYANNSYSEENYINDGYGEESYASDVYNQNGEYVGEAAYAENSYINDGYNENGYESNSYNENGYESNSYNESGYENDGYAESGNYAENEYPNDYYTDGDFYTEQTFDDNNKPIIYEDGINSSYTNVIREFPQPPAASEDMSQYNTINLQKVVAEGMMELFSDNDDIFAAEREALHATEEAAEELVPKSLSDNAVKTLETEIQDKNNDSTDHEKITEEVFSDNVIKVHFASEEKLNEETLTEEYANEEILNEEEFSVPVEKNTGKIAMITNGVSEAAPAPDTGAIKKVIVPDDNSRVIKAESDIDVLRDTTERSVNEEHARMERNSENVYHTSDLMNMEQANEPASQPMTGQMNIDDVLSEWENIKLNNAKKHEEAIKQRVLTQTGKIFANFDNSLKSGVLGELEKEEERAKDNFLAADITGDIPKTQTSETNEDEYDVSYIAPGSNKQIITEIEAVVAKELGATRIIPQDEIQREIVETENVNDIAKKLPETGEDFESNSLYDEFGEDYFEPDEMYNESSVIYSESEEMYRELDETYNDESNAYYDESNGYYEETSETYNEYETEEADSDEAKAAKTDHSKVVRELDPEDAESIAETAKEDALRTQEIKMNTADLSSLSERIVETAKREATGARREEIREFTIEEQKLFENFAVTKKIKKQILFALENMTLTAFTGNVIITGDTGIDTVRMAKNLIREFQSEDPNFSGKVAKVTGEKLNQKNLKDVFEKLNNGGIIIEKANGMTEEKLYELATFLNQENLGIVVILEDTKKEITRLLEKQAMIIDYFNIRIDLMEMDNNALVAYARNYALALEYSIDELGILALYTRIANIQSGNHVVTKDEVREIIDEAIWKSKKSKIKNFVDVLFARRYDSEDMIVLKERDFM